MKLPFLDKPTDDGPSANLWNPREIHARRSLIMLGCGAVLGLLIAGAGLFASKGTAVNVVPPEAAALINQSPILVSDLVTQLQNEFGVPYSQATKAEKQKILGDMINEELMVQRGQEMNLSASDPDVRAALVGGVELQNSATVLAEQPSQPQLKTYYDAHWDRYRTQGVLSLRDLVAPAGPDAAATMRHVAEDLRHGATPEAAMAKYKVKETGRVRDNELDFAAKIHLGAKLYDAVIDFKPGQVSDPIADTDGVHVILVTARTASVQLTLPQAQDQVFTDYKKDAQNTVQNNNMKFLRGKAQILISKDFQ